MNRDDYNPILTPKDVAGIFKVSAQTVYKWAKDGTLPAYKLQKVVRFNRDEVFAKMDSSMAKNHNCVTG